VRLIKGSRNKSGAIRRLLYGKRETASSTTNERCPLPDARCMVHMTTDDNGMRNVAPNRRSQLRMTITNIKGLGTEYDNYIADSKPTSCKVMDLPVRHRVSVFKRSSDDRRTLSEMCLPNCGFPGWFGLRFDDVSCPMEMLLVRIDSREKEINTIVTYPSNVPCSVGRTPDDLTVVFAIVPGLRIVFVDADPSQRIIGGGYHSLAAPPVPSGCSEFRSLGIEVITEDMTITKIPRNTYGKWIDICSQ
jgi:hypothetical protein